MIKYINRKLDLINKNKLRSNIYNFLCAFLLTFSANVKKVLASNNYCNFVESKNEELICKYEDNLYFDFNKYNFFKNNFDLLLQNNVNDSTNKALKKEKKLYLTFDDGPHKNTLKILDTLKKHNIKAVFFVVCQNINQNTMHIIDKIKEDGHIIGNHQEKHVIAKSPQHLYELVSKCAQKINEIYPTQNINLFRYPYGAKKSFGKEILASLDYKTDIFWDIDTLDWKYAKNKVSDDVFVKNVLQKIKEKKEGIVLFHDVNYLTAKNLDVIINELKNEGYLFDLLHK